MTQNQKIGVNFWDDFYEDGHVPQGESQDTFAYVESKCSEGECKEVLTLIKETIERLKEPEWLFNMELNYYDSAKVYPNLVGTENAWCLYKRWQLEMKNISHDILEDLIILLRKESLTIHDQEIQVYSES